MSMQFSKEELRENYAQLTDVKIFKLATQEAETLAPEVKEILQEEIKKREIIIPPPVLPQKTNKLQQLVANFLSHFR
jgi:hypothetical protein